MNRKQLINHIIDEVLSIIPDTIVQYSNAHDYSAGTEHINNPDIESILELKEDLLKQLKQDEDKKEEVLGEQKS